MSTTVEVFAEITCPFAYVGLTRVSEHVAELGRPVEVLVRAWPLEWVNGTLLDFATREGFRRIGFGECRGIIEPAR